MARNVVGTPARGEDFYDREELVAQLWSRLDVGSVLLAAPRRFGKTSVMYRLIDEPRPGWRVVHLDAEAIREPANFVVALLDALLADQKIRNFLKKTWKKSGRGFWKRLSSVVLKGPGGVEFRIALKDALGEDWQERGAALLQALRSYGDMGERLLIIIDELPVMLHLFRENEVPDEEAKAFLYWFRKLRVDPGVGLSDCRFVVGGSIGIEYYLSALGATAAFNDFERMTLGELSKDRARGLLRELLADRKLELSPRAERRALELIGAPIPYFIQVFVSEMVAARIGGPKSLGPKSLEAVYHDRVLSANCKGYFQHYYERLSRYDKPLERAAKEVLKAIALAQPERVRASTLRSVFAKAMGESHSDDIFAGLLGDLENDFYVRCDRDGCAFASKVLCDWWRRYYAF
ncbi:hypothetical protein HQ560_05910 [bacterium]|nr:hypothetical protein [bacterium]